MRSAVRSRLIPGSNKLDSHRNLIIKVVSLEDAIKLQYSNGIECTPENLANTEIKDFTYHLQSILTKYIEDLPLNP